MFLFVFSFVCLIFLIDYDEGECLFDVEANSNEGSIIIIKHETRVTIGGDESNQGKRFKNVSENLRLIN